MAKDPASEIKKLQQMNSEQLLAMRAEQVKTYESPGIGGLFRNAGRAAKAALIGGGSQALSGFVGRKIGFLGFLNNDTVRKVIGYGVAVYSFFASMTEYRNDIRNEAASNVTNIDIILNARATQSAQPTLQSLSQDDLARLRQAQQAQGENIGQFTQNAGNRGAGQAAAI